MLKLIIFIFASYGLTQIVVYGSIFDSVRPSKDWLGGYGKLFHCPMCFGFWAGLIIYFMIFGISPSLFISSIVYAFISSGTSYMLCMMFNDFGISLNIHKRG